jgi:hypothetical protein
MTMAVVMGVARQQSIGEFLQHLQAAKVIWGGGESGSPVEF